MRGRADIGMTFAAAAVPLLLRRVTQAGAVCSIPFAGVVQLAPVLEILALLRNLL